VHLTFRTKETSPQASDRSAEVVLSAQKHPVLSCRRKIYQIKPTPTPLQLLTLWSTCHLTLVYLVKVQKLNWLPSFPRYRGTVRCRSSLENKHQNNFSPALDTLTLWFPKHHSERKVHTSNPSTRRSLKYEDTLRTSWKYQKTWFQHQESS
jgi:hypothetical protein